MTRLNQRIVVGDSAQSVGEEEARKPLRAHIEKVIGQLGSPGNKGSSWVIDCEYDFSKPLPSAKIVDSQITEALTPLSQPYDEAVISGLRSKYFSHRRHTREASFLGLSHLCLDCGIGLELMEFYHEPAKFILQNVSDGLGMFVAPEMKASIQDRILDKSTKIRKQGKIGKYKSWWLVLVDHLCHLPMTCLLEHELSLVRDQRFEFWSRVVIVSSRKPSWHYELLSR